VREDYAAQWAITQTELMEKLLLYPREQNQTSWTTGPKDKTTPAMTILLNNVYVALEQGIINTDQALYLIYTHREITYPIKVKELFQLTQLKYIVEIK
jgi:hypothetical protein